MSAAVRKMSAIFTIIIMKGMIYGTKSVVF